MHQYVLTSRDDDDDNGANNGNNNTMVVWKLSWPQSLHICETSKATQTCYAFCDTRVSVCRNNVLYVYRNFNKIN